MTNVCVIFLLTFDRT